VAKRRSLEKRHQALPAIPWWKVKQNWIAIGVLVAILIFMGVLAVDGKIGGGMSGLRGVGF
jgi:hypothetical protein